MIVPRLGGGRPPGRGSATHTAARSGPSAAPGTRTRHPGDHEHSGDAVTVNGVKCRPIGDTSWLDRQCPFGTLLPASTWLVWRRIRRLDRTHGKVGVSPAHPLQCAPTKVR